ncbi:hypothetical protein JOQ06_022587, partial [Pogonophryne albipinna]
MSLQWTAVATFLYGEVFFVLLLCIPFISPKRWSKIFKSRIIQTIALYGNTSFMVAIAILVFLLIDAFREVRKYSVPEKVDLTNNPTAIEHIHMKLFRAQRNELLRRLATLLSQQATFMASNEAFKKQAEGASNAAKKYMEENELLQEKLRDAGLDLPEVGKKGAGPVEENKNLKEEVKTLKEELDNNKKGGRGRVFSRRWAWPCFLPEVGVAVFSPGGGRGRVFSRRWAGPCFLPEVGGAVFSPGGGRGRVFSLRWAGPCFLPEVGGAVFSPGTLQKSDSDVRAMKSQAKNLTVEYDRLLDEHSKLL